MELVNQYILHLQTNLVLFFTQSQIRLWISSDATICFFYVSVVLISLDDALKVLYNFKCSSVHPSETFCGTRDFLGSYSQFLVKNSSTNKQLLNDYFIRLSVIALLFKDLLCQMRHINSMSRGNASCLQTGSKQYHTQLGLLDKCRTVKGLVYRKLNKLKQLKFFNFFLI